jgi:hypothetical protein
MGRDNGVRTWEEMLTGSWDDLFRNYTDITELYLNLELTALN